MTRNLIARAPASLMLMGEHAVLHGQPALALAVDAWITTRLTARDDRHCSIQSELGSYSASLDQLDSSRQLSFVVEAIRQMQAQLPGGFELTIESDFSSQVGLGSSAAVTLSVLAALSRYAGLSDSQQSLFERGLKVVHSVQNGRGSGTDLAVSAYGGTIAFDAVHRSVRSLPLLPNFNLHYVGYKLATPAVLETVERQTASIGPLIDKLYHLMGQTTVQAEIAISERDWSKLGQLMNVYAGLMDALGVCDGRLAALQYQLRAAPGCLGAKISGSGLGDCVISLLERPTDLAEFQRIPVTQSKQGVSVTEVNDD